MKTLEFLDLLKQHKDKTLLFEYAPNLLVGANYHITEVKHITVDSVDCGAATDHWRETVIQLWESPEEIGKTEYMSTYKALSILNKVGTMKPYIMESEVKIEYGNPLFHTAQLFVNDFEIHNSQLRFKLAVAPTDCKAKETCGVAEPAMAQDQQGGCAPGSGCC